MSHDVEDHQIPTTLVTSLIHLAAIDEPRRPGMTVFDWTDHTRRHIKTRVFGHSYYVWLHKPSKD